MQFQLSKLGTFSPAPVQKQVRQPINVVRAQSGANRDLWVPDFEPPSWLDGTYPGDYGFDPLQLAKDPERFKYFREAEIYNGRWAMAGVAGMIFPELIGKANFWNAGAEAGTGPFDFKTLLAIEIAAVGFFEYFRYKNYKEKGTMSGVLLWFPFDPLGLGKQANMQNKEIENGRLAMIAFFGIFFQYFEYGKGPIANLKDHIADPWNNNIYTSRIGNEFTAFAILFAMLPTLIKAKQSIGKDHPEALQPVPFGLILAPLAAIVLGIHVYTGSITP